MAGELPPEGHSVLLVAAFEREEALLDLIQAREVVGGERLALDEREVDLHLVQPRGVDGYVHKVEVRPSGRQSFDGLLAAMGAAVVDDPEHPAGRGVGLDAHDLLDEPPERLDAGASLVAAEHLRAMDIRWSEMLQRASALEFHALYATAGSRQGLVAAGAGLVIGGYDEIMLAECLALVDPSVEVENASGLDLELWVTGKDPWPLLPRSDRVLGQPAPDPGPRDLGDDSSADDLGGRPRWRCRARVGG